MKRFHVHLNVKDLQQNIAFYTALFGQSPVREESDYAKWHLDDPAINFAISTRQGTEGVDHLGLQVDNAQDLQVIKERARQADMSMLDEGTTTCCYSRSDKYWITDPQGIAWEQFHTLEGIPTFNEAKPVADATAAPACCAPKAANSPGKTTSSCC